MTKSPDKQLVFFNEMIEDFVAEKSYITEKEEAVLYALAITKTNCRTPKDAQFPPLNMFCITPYCGGYEVIGFYDSGTGDCKLRIPFTVYVQKNMTHWEEFDPRCKLSPPDRLRFLPMILCATSVVLIAVAAVLLMNK